MRHLLSVIIAALVLVAVVTGCDGMWRYDARLVAADSLMHDHPDSALALVQAIEPGSLTRERDRAYRDLLLTQGRYRSYVPATSDSDINRALDYYLAHDGEREKLTRAYIYKGAVMEELGLPDSAMIYYKYAEATAAPDDYFNLGYINMRMGALYRDNYSVDGKHIEKYEQALSYFKKIRNSNYQLTCMINLGSLYRLKMPEKSKSTLLLAQSFALALNDSSRYIKCLQNLVETYYVLKDYRKAKELINEVMKIGGTESLGIGFCANATDVYSKLGMPDSAEYFLNMSSHNSFSSVIDEMLYMESIGELALARGDTALYQLMDNNCTHKHDSLQALGASMKILQTEIALDKLMQQRNNQKRQTFKVCLFLIIVVFIIIIIFFCYVYYQRKHRYDNLIADLRNADTSHIRELEVLHGRIKDLDIKDKKITEYLDSHLWLMRNVIDECYNIPNDKLVKKLQNIFRYQEQNKDKWSKLFSYIDTRYYNILSNTKKNHSQLNERDIMLLALTILGFSCVQITMVLGYSNPTSVGIIRQRLAKKMNLTISLKQYIDQYMSDQQRI